VWSTYSKSLITRSGQGHNEAFSFTLGNVKKKSLRIMFIETTKGFGLLNGHTLPCDANSSYFSNVLCHHPHHLYRISKGGCFILDYMLLYILGKFFKNHILIYHRITIHQVNV
jgi:hypothetical protein